MKEYIEFYKTLIGLLEKDGYVYNGEIGILDYNGNDFHSFIKDCLNSYSKEQLEELYINTVLYQVQEKTKDRFYVSYNCGVPCGVSYESTPKNSLYGVNTEVLFALCDYFEKTKSEKVIKFLRTYQTIICSAHLFERDNRCKTCGKSL